MMRRSFGAVLVLAVGLGVPPKGAAQLSGVENGEWRYLGGDAGHTRSNPGLTQIDASNFSELEVAWIWWGSNFGAGHLDVWYQFGRPSGIAIGADDRIYVADSESFGSDNPGWKKGIRVGSASDGSVEYLIEDLEPTAIEHSGAEGVGVDSQGNVYGAVVRRRMLEKHVPTSRPASANAVAPSGDPVPTHIGHVAFGFNGAPDGKGLAATASAEVGTALLHANFTAADLSDLAAMQRHAGHVLHILEPVEGTAGPGLGFGVIPAVEGLVRHLELAAGAAGVSDNVRTHTRHVTAIADGVLANAREAAGVAQQLQAAVSIRQAASLVARLRLLAYQITEGHDLDGDGQLSFDGEAGMQQLEAHLYLLLEGEGLARELR